MFWGEWGGGDTEKGPEGRMEGGEGVRKKRERGEGEGEGKDGGEEVGRELGRGGGGG